MNPDDQRRHSKKSFPLLVVEGNEDHQLLIGYGLRASMPAVRPSMASNGDMALIHLKITDSERYNFPRLVLLDIYLPTIKVGLDILETIRRVYPRLPVIVFSSDDDSSVVGKAYELGAHSFIRKPLGLEQWERYFQVLNDYWLNTVTLVSNY